MTQRHDQMFTQLTISVQGKKGSGKSAFASQVLVEAVKLLGGTIVKVNDDKTGVYVTVSLPQGVLAPDKAPGVMQKLHGLLVKTAGGGEPPRFGDDVELRDGLIRAKAVPAAAAPLRAGNLLPVNESACARLKELLLRRDVAEKSLGQMAAAQMIQAPRFVPPEDLQRLLAVHAEAEIAAVDRELARLGLRYAVP